MKKLGLMLIAAATALVFCSCNDNDGDYASYNCFATVKTIPGATDYYFKMDNGKTVYPGDRSRIGTYKAKDGQRAIIWFSLLSEGVSDYDYNAALYAIADLYTGAAAIVTQEELDALADDAISLIDAQLNEDYLTLRVAYPVTDHSKHNFHLVRLDNAQETPTEEGYLDVQLRHDAGGDLQGNDEYFYISFSLDELQQMMQDMKGLTLRVKTQYNGEKFVQITTR